MNELPDNNREEAFRWLDGVDGDLRALDALRSDAHTPGRIICILAHLAVEKALKATLIDAGVAFRKTHDLVELQTMCTDTGRLAGLDRERLQLLNPWAIDGRYGDDLRDASRETAAGFHDFAKEVVAAAHVELDRNAGEV